MAKFLGRSPATLHLSKNLGPFDLVVRPTPIDNRHLSVAGRTASRLGSLALDVAE